MTPAQAVLLETIDWDMDASALQRGDLSGLPTGILDMIAHATQLPEVLVLANSLSTSPELVVVGLLAQAASHYSQTARRLADALLKGASDQHLVAAITVLRALQRRRRSIWRGLWKQFTGG